MLLCLFNTQYMHTLYILCTFDKSVCQLKNVNDDSVWNMLLNSLSSQRIPSKPAAQTHFPGWKHVPPFKQVMLQFAVNAVKNRLCRLKVSLTARVLTI